MNIVHNRYFDVVIHDNNSFCIIETASKPQECGSALHTLKKIERIVHENLQYAFSNDIYSTLHTEEIYQVLQGKAVEIGTGYREKFSDLNWVWKILLWITGARKELIAINAAQTKIETRVSRSHMFPLLPEEILQHIGSYLPIADLLTWNSVNRHGSMGSNLAILNRAREFGYKGNELSKAIAHIQDFFSYLWSLRHCRSLAHFFDQENKETYSPECSERVANTLKCIDLSTDFMPLLLNLYEEVDNHRIPTSRFYYLNNFLIKNYLTQIRIHKNPLIQWNDALKSQAARMLNRATYYATVHLKDIEFVKILLEAGVNPNTLDRHGCYPLDHAAEEGYEEIVQLLLHYGANVNAINTLGETALIAICRRSFIDTEQHLAIVQTLLNHGADLTICDREDTSPLHFAAICRHTSIIEELMHHGAQQINQRNSLEGNTPLMFACNTLCSVDTVRCLLSYGADPTLVNKAGKTALRIVQERYEFKSLSTSDVMGDNYAPLTTEDENNYREIVGMLTGQIVVPRKSLL